MDTRNPTIVAKTWMDSEASVIKSLLESYNIPCHYTSDLIHNLYPLSGDGRGEIRIYVPGPLAEVAHRILAEHRRMYANLRLVEDDELERKKV